jgi:hypothetical protein
MRWNSNAIHVYRHHLYSFISETNTLMQLRLNKENAQNDYAGDRQSKQSKIWALQAPLLPYHVNFPLSRINSVEF